MTDTTPAVAAISVCGHPVLRRARDLALRRRHEPARRLSEPEPGRDAVGHRPQRRREDLVVQLSDGRVPAPGGLDPVHPEERALRERDRPQALQGEPARGREDVPDLPHVQCADGVREREDRGRVQAAHRAHRRHAPIAPHPARGARERSQDPGAVEVRRAHPAGERPLELVGLRGPAAPRDRPGARDEPGGAAAGRACRGDQPGREDRAGRA